MAQHKGLRALGLGIVLAVTVGACSSATPGAARRDQAWTDRLNGLAAAHEQERANEAWAARYAKMATAYQSEQVRQQRADAASSQRMTKLAEYILNGGKIG
jgi:hypothetical protein